MFKRSQVSIAAVVALSGLAPMSAIAQSTVQRVEITGSSIKRVDNETSLPVSVITRDEIAKSGVVDLEQLMQRIVSTSTAGASRGSDLAGLATYGVSTVSLRGLGENRTLVLVNGKRMAASPNGASTAPVDLNSIPLSAIERVEILRDGASATYGSDAVAGVVNFILRKDYIGVELSATSGRPSRSGGGKSDSISILFGKGDLASDRFNVLLGASFERGTALFAKERDFSSSGNRLPFFQNAATPSGRVEGIWIPGQTLKQNSRVAATNPFGYSSSGYGNPKAPDNCGDINMFPVAKKGGVGGVFYNCNFDSAPFVGLFPDSERSSFFGTLKYQLGTNTTAYAEALFARTRVTEAYQPAPNRVAFMSTDNAFFDPVQNPTNVDPALILRPSNPAYKSVLSPYLLSHGLAAMDGQPIAITSRAFGSGPRTEQDTNQGTRFTVGIQGLFGSWDYDVSLLRSEAKVGGSLTDGYFSYLKVAKIINDPASTWNPWALGGVQDAATTAAFKSANYIGPTATGLSHLTSLDATASSNLMSLPGGNAQLALGASLRREDYKLGVSAILGSGDIAGLGGATLPENSSRTTTALFTELNLPLSKTFEANGSVRYDRYNDVGTTLNGKASFRWMPVKEIVLRGAVGTGFRAPTLVELHLPQTVGTSEQFIDPLFPGDGDVQVNSIRAGNSHLKPEKSKQYSLGIVFTPISSLKIGVDWFRINIDDFIISPAALGLVKAARAGKPLYGPGDVVFADDGTVDTVDQTLRNAASAAVQGIDLTVNWADKFSFGRVSVDLNGTLMDKFDLKTISGVQNSVGTIIQADGSPLDVSSIGVVVRWRHTLSLSWSDGPFAATFSQNFYKGYQDKADVTGNPHFVPDTATYDAQASFTGVKNLKMSLGVKNLFDKKPPLFIGNGSSFQYGYDPTMSDPRRRYIYVSGTYRF